MDGPCTPNINRFDFFSYLTKIFKQFHKSRIEFEVMWMKHFDLFDHLMFISMVVREKNMSNSWHEKR